MRVIMHFNAGTHVGTAKLMAEEMARELGVGPIFFSEDKEFCVAIGDDMLASIVARQFMRSDHVRAVTIAKGEFDAKRAGRI